MKKTCKKFYLEDRKSSQKATQLCSIRHRCPLPMNATVNLTQNNICHYRELTFLF